MNGYGVLTPTQILLGPAVVYRAGTPWAVSRGGVRVELDREIREVEFDGRRAPVNGLDRVVSHGIRVTGTFLEWNVLQAQRYEAGVTAGVAGQVNTITPRDANAMFPSGAYISDLFVVVKRGDNSLVGFRIPRAHVLYSVGGEDKSEAGIDTTFEARLNYGGAVGIMSSPFVVELGGSVSGTTITDTFNRVDSAVTLGSTDTGQAWVALNGTWGISTNRAYVVSSTGRAYAYVLTTLSDCTISIDLPVLPDGGPSFRIVDIDNLFNVVAEVGTYKLYRKQAAGFTEIGSGGSPTAGDVVVVVLAGSSITVKRNGATIIGPVTDAFQSTAVRHGLTDGGITGRFDNLSITG